MLEQLKQLNISLINKLIKQGVLPKEILQQVKKVISSKSIVGLSKGKESTRNKIK